MTDPDDALVGRAFELAEVVELVRTHRLVTLTGVGGVGKTRLALAVGAGLADEFPDGVWLVELAPVADADSVPDAFATALGITPRADVPITETLADTLAGRRLLVVLDNCEHVVDAAAATVDVITCPSRHGHGPRDVPRGSARRRRAPGGRPADGSRRWRGVRRGRALRRSGPVRSTRASRSTTVRPPTR